MVGRQGYGQGTERNLKTPCCRHLPSPCLEDLLECRGLVCLGDNALGNSYPSIIREANSKYPDPLWFIPGPQTLSRLLYVADAHLLGSEGPPEGTVTRGRSRRRRPGCRSRFCPSVAVSFRATSFPLCEKDPSLLCSYFSPSSWAVRTHKLLSKASLKASRKLGYSEAPLGESLETRHHRTQRSL